MASIITFIQAHEVAMAMFGVAVLDFLFAINPMAESNGILHWIYTALKGIESAQPAPKA